MDHRLLGDRFHEFSRVIEDYPATEHLQRGHGRELCDEFTLETVFEGFEFDFALGRGHHGGEVTRAWHHDLVTEAQRPSVGIRDDGFVVGDGQADRDT